MKLLSLLSFLIVFLLASLSSKTVLAIVPSDYTAEYFNNNNLSGTPTLTRDDPLVNFNWGTGSPDPLIHNDFFSARWTKTATLESGYYQFTIVGDDGYRLFIDGDEVINRWFEQAASVFKVSKYLNAGDHTIIFEYFENGGAAISQMGYVKLPTTDPAPPSNQFHGEFYNNTAFSGTPVFTHDYDQVNFSWGSGSPDPSVNSDFFSGRYTKTIHFSAGYYVFRTSADDGNRLFIDDQKIIDHWWEEFTWQRNPQISTIKYLTEGDHSIRFEYFEDGGASYGILDYVKDHDGVPLPTPTPSPSPSPTPTPIPTPSPSPSSSPSSILIGEFNGYKLYDDGLVGITLPCEGKSVNSSGIGVQANGRNTELVWNGFILATIVPSEDNPLSKVLGQFINESGQVVGGYHNNNAPPSKQNNAFFWQNGDLKVIAQGDSGHGGSVYGITDKGYVAASIGILDGFIWKDDIHTSLGGLPGAPYKAIPTCIDEFNNMSGSALGPFPDFTEHHVHWVPVTPPTDKNPPVPLVGEYFDSQTLTGTPKVVRLDPKINFVWNDTSQDPLIPNDHFSVRWTKTQFMKAGKYSFTLKSDDGIRFWVDSTLVIDDWTNHAMRIYTPDILVNEGNHSFKVEYFENTGGAVAILNEDFPARDNTTAITIP